MKDIEDYISRLRTIKNMACDLRVTTQTIYNRISRGELRSVIIDGVTFVIIDGNEGRMEKGQEF